MRKTFILLLILLFLFSLPSFGAVWFKQYESSDHAALLEVYFINNRVGYAVGAGGKILKTTNRGKNWSEIPSGTANNISGVYYLGNKLYVTTNDGNLKTSTDEGTTWNTTAISNQVLKGVWFADENNGFVCGFYDNTIPFTLGVTASGETTWTKYDPLPNNSATRLHGTGANNVWASYAKYISHWDGNNWSSTSAVDAGYNEYLFGLHAFDSSNVFAVGHYYAATGANAFITSDGGVNWTKMNIASGTQDLRDVSFVSSSTGWAVGRDGKIYATAAGGGNAAAWTEEISPTDQLLYSVHFVDAANGWAVGGGDVSPAVIIKRAISPEVSSLNPSSITAGESGNITVTGNYFLGTAASTEDAPSVVFSGTGITVNSVTYNNITEIVANISVAADAAGDRTVSATNPDGAAGTITASFTVQSTTTTTAAGETTTTTTAGETTTTTAAGETTTTTGATTTTIATGGGGSAGDPTRTVDAVPAKSTFDPETEPVKLQIQPDPGVVESDGIRVKFFQLGNLIFQKEYPGAIAGNVNIEADLRNSHVTSGMVVIIIESLKTGKVLQRSKIMFYRGLP